ncbi:glucose-6-phosphate isomerase [Aliikangiella coralliicola]|uniref:Glucose-6-phosphate isomerase n=1 Tax=Aliikangiella coralliicola TaxID=2592383 RepID=A0A545TSN4_9GAMM|nr:glucose-6-phosphate isomerase [Aliikangiella coralliicola]TQV80228.1 glucose-6-phosphate isomerase [Aliikangiella coralliicola]
MNATEAKTWNKLQKHLDDELANVRIEELNKCDKRSDLLSFNFDQLLVDFSKQKVNSNTMQLLFELGEELNLTNAIKNLASGDKVNTTENRPALHSALRLNPNDSLVLDGDDINRHVQIELARMSKVVDDITTGNWRGYSGKPITDVVNLGVGGSDLGPLLVCEALDEFKEAHSNPVDVHFASTMDGSQVSLLFERLNPETTLFVIVSKSFTTIDTLSNAASAKAWLLNAFQDESIIIKQHFIGISVSESKMEKWGIHPEHQLKLWDWVGGRFSLWSAVGLTIALKIGMANFRRLLNGANKLDQHFFSTDINQNIPVILGLLGIWNTNFLNIKAQAILPYDARLKYFPDYLTQLEMESNGKSVTLQGERISFDTCPILWGEVGPNAQHAFYQLLHQGTRKVACDFIAPVNRFSTITSEHEKSLHNQHLLTIANCFAQSRALMVGGSSAVDGGGSSELKNHKFYPGDQSSTTILIPELTPYSLGQLIALYEHKVFVMATIWGINPFDQWGVELGKLMANDTLRELNLDSMTMCFDASTNYLMNYVKSNFATFKGVEEDK